MIQAKKPAEKKPDKEIKKPYSVSLTETEARKIKEQYGSITNCLLIHMLFELC